METSLRVGPGINSTSESSCPFEPTFFGPIAAPAETTKWPGCPWSRWTQEWITCDMCEWITCDTTCWHWLRQAISSNLLEELLQRSWVGSRPHACSHHKSKFLDHIKVRSATKSLRRHWITVRTFNAPKDLKERLGRVVGKMIPQSFETFDLD